MFYKMISGARERWYNSPNCTVSSLIDYITGTGQMRDAQLDAIKTYLFLKIGCGNAPLYRLFTEGKFNTLNLDELEISSKTRQFLSANPAAAALYEYSCMTNVDGKMVAPKLAEQIRANADSIDYRAFFKKAFYGVTYTDYLFSLPMGAGKTYLMAAFIYLDLYFAKMEPSNSAFAHNFIVFAPSGLKSSVVPSLKTIQKFNPAWVLPEPAASNMKRSLIFEVLDQGKTASKSNKTKNPNVQKIANHQPLSELFGLVAVTNAEKVILDRIEEKNGQLSFLEDDKDKQANELRNLIGKLPSLSIFIDEVHHAVSDEIKLRAVVNRWMENNTVNSVIGFSGTPYLEKAEKINVTGTLSVSTAEINNVVFYYPLINGVGNFLKKPIVKISDVKDSLSIIDAGVRTFLDSYKGTVYNGGLSAKLGIYCGSIEKCEELVYPLVSQILAEYGIPNTAILKYHKGNKKYPQPADSQMQFETLDSPLSNIRVVLLVQIGKEGWDCRSLTGIILSQEGDCPRNMVLQTSCRCLRQVIKSSPETALIYLNSDNAAKLNAQLMQQQHISLEEFSNARPQKTTLKRYNRTTYLKLPKVEYYQLKIRYDTVTVERCTDIDALLRAAADGTERSAIVKTTDFTMEIQQTEVIDSENGTDPAAFTSWLYRIFKGGFGAVTMAQLKEHTDTLKVLFDKLTYSKDGSRYYSSRFNLPVVEANIRKAFYEKRDFTTIEELVPDEASLLNITNFTDTVETATPSDYYPPQDTVENIIKDDKGKLKPDVKTEEIIQTLLETGNADIAEKLRAKTVSHPQKDRSFHYLPYHTDSPFEQTFLREVLTMKEIEQFNLEVYYNGDRAMTDFKIKCYKSAGKKWKYIGMYTPDFLIIQRKDGKIHKAIIVETKGSIYAKDTVFQDKRTFMESEFLTQNNSKYGYSRFDYLYLEDSLSESERILETHEKICSFFRED